MSKLTAAKIKGLTKRGAYCDSGGLYLQVAKGGSKSWIQRIMVNGKRKNIGLGGFQVISISKARELSLKTRLEVAEGNDPTAKKLKMLSFREAMQLTLEKKRGEWTSAVVEKNWQGRLDTHVLEQWGERKINTIDQIDALELLKPLYEQTPETGRKIRQALRSIFGLAMAKGLIDTDPAGERISKALPGRPKKKNHAALHNGQVAEFLCKVDESDAALSVKLAVRFIVLTAARSGEVRGARWSEIQGDAWIIPEERMKMRQEHCVPLSKAALEVLEKARALHDGDLIFPALRSGKEIAESNLRNLLKKIGMKTTIHGFRSSFRSFCASRNINREIAEAALAHAVAGVEGDYQRDDLFELRREVMETWGGYVTGAHEGAKVIAIAG